MQYFILPEIFETSWGLPVPISQKKNQQKDAIDLAESQSKKKLAQKKKVGTKRASEATSSRDQPPVKIRDTQEKLDVSTLFLKLIQLFSVDAAALSRKIRRSNDRNSKVGLG